MANDELREGFTSDELEHPGSSVDQDSIVQPISTAQDDGRLEDAAGVTPLPVHQVLEDVIQKGTDTNR